MNPNWDRWIFASICKFFTDRADGLIMYVEGTEHPAPTEASYVEIRTTGPITKQLTSNSFKLDVIINALINVLGEHGDNHLIYRITGKIASIFQSCIPVFKFGDTADDNPTIQIGVLQLTPNGGRDIETSHFGQVAPDVKLLQSTVEGAYKIYLP